MKKIITSSLIVATLFASQAIAQEKRNKEIKKPSQSITVQPRSTVKKVDSDQKAVTKPARKSKELKQTDMRMPEKTDNKAKEWRKDGLKKRKKGMHVSPNNSVSAVKSKDDREFGQYDSWQKRSQVAKDEDWARLNDIISNKVNLPKESKSIIKKKREEIKRDLNAKRISEHEYKQLYKELNYAQEDVEKIEVWVGGKK